MGQPSTNKIDFKLNLGSEEDDSQQEDEVSQQERDDLSPTAGQTWRRALRVVQMPLRQVVGPSRPVMVKVLFSVTDL